MAESGFRKLIITITAISCSLLELIDTSIVNVALPHIMGNIGATLSEVSWVVTGYVVANVLFIPLTDWLSSHFGRKRYFTGSILLFVAASALCGQSTTLWEIVTFRIMQGIGGAALLTISRVILIEAYPEEELGLANALFGLGAVVGPTIGPTLGGWLTTHYSWPWIFYINVPVGIVAFILATIFVSDADYEDKVQKVDWWGIGLLLVGVGSLQFVLERGEDNDWFASNMILILTVIAAIGVVAFIIRELYAEHPVVDLRVLKNRPLAIGAFFMFILGFGLYGSIFAFPVFTQRLLGYSALDTGLILLPGGLMTAFMMPIVGNLLRRGVAPQLLAAIGFVVFFIFSLMLSRETMASGESDFFWPLIIRGVGLGCLFVPLSTIAFTGIKGKALSMGSALLNMTRQLGGSFGVAIIATFIERRQAFHRSVLTDHVSMYDTQTQHQLAQYVHGFQGAGASHSVAQNQAYAAINGLIQQQSALMSYNDTFYIVGFFFLICLPLLLFTFVKNKDKNAEKQQESTPELEPAH